ncbi:MAG: 4-(cytidine 5'-diphospho)-2-C-methyl-D-erythritol kinase [Ignavibacteria bacterium]|nr:4-(cytidine 5'-diphospho)-2-C-methyl-D-erythritol kinase [Ignavibacteria bacterium]
MTTIHRKAFAKINIGLNVLGKRLDGYHDVESVFVAIDLHDDITIEASTELQVNCFPVVTEFPQENLVYRAAESLRNHAGLTSESAKITVSKRIPINAGLGGGSSDAAATLLGLSDFWEIHTDLHDIACALGSDVPYFLTGGICCVTGRGEKVRPITMSDPALKRLNTWHILIVVPDVQISTATAYSTLGTIRTTPQIGLNEKFIQAIDNDKLWSKYFINDFEKTIFAEVPILSTIKDKLLSEGAFYASMTGSGSVIYGLYTSPATADNARKAFPTMETYICRPLTASLHA